MGTQDPMEMVEEATVEIQEVEDLVEEAEIQEVEDLVEEAADGTPAAEAQAHQEDLEDTVEDGILAVVDGTLVSEVQVHQVDHHLCPVVQDLMTLTPGSPHLYANLI
jgi:hypothetical protein